MKKTINISLAGMSFTAEEDAYRELEAYLQEVKTHFATFPDAGEILRDIEARFAEQFSHKAGTGFVVNLSEVESVIAVLGRPQEFAGDSYGAAESEKKHESHASQEKSNKRLLRDSGDVIIAGVASGIAAYLGIDPVWPRLAFAISVFFGGFGVILYVILWLVLPQAKTEADRMEMRGQTVNLKNLEELAKSRVNEFKNRDHSQLQKGLRRFAQGVVSVIQKILLAISKVLGFVLLLAASLGIAGLITLALGMLFNAESPYVDLPLAGIVHGASYYVGIASGFFVIFVPLVFLVLLGTKILTNKPVYRKSYTLSLVALWIVSGAVFLNTAVHVAPQIQYTLEHDPRYQTVTKEVDAKDFTKVQLSGADAAVLYPSDVFRVVVQGRQRDIDESSFEVRDGTLYVSHTTTRNICLFCGERPLKLEIYAPQINGIKLTGGSQIHAENIKSEDFNLAMSGASRTYLEGEVKNLQVHLSGASDLVLLGDIENSIFELSGASQVHADEALVKSVNVKASGASDLSFGVLQNLEARLSGASQVFYVSADQLKESTTGASELIQLPKKSYPVIE